MLSGRILLGVFGLLFVLAILNDVSALSDRTNKREVVPPPPQESVARHWRMTRRPDESAQINFYLMLRTGKEEWIKQTASEVSNPRSPRYQQYLSREELFASAAAPPGVEESVAHWLRSLSGDEPLNLVSYGDAIKVSTTVRNAENVLDTTFQVYIHRKNNHQIIRSDLGVRLPVDIAEHVSYVMGVSEFTLPIKVTPSHSKLRPRAGEEPFIIPSILKTAYNTATLPATATQSTNRQGIAAFDDYYSPSALREFESAFGLSQATVVNAGTADCTPTCDQVESNLDVQYITAMGTGAETIFREYSGNSFTAELAMDLANPNVVPSSQVASIYSISYGFDEITGIPYIGVSELQLAKLSTIGITVFVSSGDDGAQGPDAFNCPLDTSHYCPFGGCTHSSTMCGGYIVTRLSSKCIFPTGVAVYSTERTSQDCTDLGQSAVVGASFDEWAADQLSQHSCTIAIETDVYGQYFFYSNCSCGTLTSFTSSSNHVYTPYTYDPSNGPALLPGYPATSEWVTTVGATQFVGASAPYIELPASILSTPPAFVTSGGGFSAVITRPSWQDAAVTGYLTAKAATLPPTSLFNVTGRGFPDISLNGHNYVIFANTFNGSSQCIPYCNASVVDGTSASSPAVAGLFSLINDALVSAGRPTLGFLNPLLYSMAADDVSTFFDITVGDNRASAVFPCIYGYDSASGWDPVTGLGSPNFANVYSYILGQSVSASSALFPTINWLYHE